MSRAYGILRTAQTISSEETMHLLSSVRMGVNLGLIHDLEIPTLNKLFIYTQPAHLQKLSGVRARHGRPQHRACPLSAAVSEQGKRREQELMPDSGCYRAIPCVRISQTCSSLADRGTTSKRSSGTTGSNIINTARPQNVGGFSPVLWDAIGRAMPGRRLPGPAAASFCASADLVGKPGVETIPVLGTGKTEYKVLRKLAAAAGEPGRRLTSYSVSQ